MSGTHMTHRAVTETERQRLLALVIRAAREELTSLDFDDVPHQLRPVVQSTARKLPPPLARVLLNAVGSDNALRGAVSDRLDGMELPFAVAAFLSDPDSSDEPLALQADADRAELIQRERDTAMTTITKLEARLIEAKERLKEAAEQRRLLRSDAEAAQRRATAGMERRLADTQAKLDEANAERERLKATIADLHETIGYLRLRWAKRDERAKRRPTANSHDTLRLAVGADSFDPLELAKRLDRQANLMKYYRETETGESSEANEVHDEVFGLPPGIAPDTVAGVDAAFAHGPDRVLIDGYNVAGVVAPESVGAKPGRRIALAYADRLKHRIPDSEVVVVFDASGVDGRGGFTTDAGVEVIFEGESIADDRIADEVMDRTDRCVVVTSDHELQARCHRERCVAVFSSAFVKSIEGLND
jgi:predicted RNA-binding protein with PIN domain